MIQRMTFWILGTERCAIVAADIFAKSSSLVAIRIPSTIIVVRTMRGSSRGSCLWSCWLANSWRSLMIPLTCTNRVAVNRDARIVSTTWIWWARIFLSILLKMFTDFVTHLPRIASMILITHTMSRIVNHDAFCKFSASRTCAGWSQTGRGPNVVWSRKRWCGREYLFRVTFYKLNLCT